jgi:hypothetical protein
MTDEEIQAASYETLMFRNTELAELLNKATAKKGVPWHTLSVELAVLAEERRMVTARMAQLSKKGLQR